MENLFSLQFWFDTSPVRLGDNFEMGFFILFSLMLVAGVVLQIAKKNSNRDKFAKEALARSASALMTFGVLGFVWLFFTYEEVQFFGMRFWFAVWVGALVVVCCQINNYIRKEIPVRRLQQAHQADANKYLPRSNRR